MQCLECLQLLSDVYLLSGLFLLVIQKIFIDISISHFKILGC